MSDEATARLSALIAPTGRSVHALHSALALRGRAAFLRYLKEEGGIARMSDRQCITNALTAAGRPSQLPSPSIEALRSLLLTPPVTLALCASHRRETGAHRSERRHDRILASDS